VVDAAQRLIGDQVQPQVAAQIASGSQCVTSSRRRRSKVG